MNIGLFLGDICQAPADVICTSTNPHLDLMIGTGGAVRSAGGWSIQEECYETVREKSGAPDQTYLEPGQVVRTGAGLLPYKAVLHCVAIDSFHNSSALIIQQCVQNAVAEFRKITGAESIAFPIFASGNGRFEFSSSLSEICLAVKECWPEQLKQAWFVIYEEYHRNEAEKILRREFGDIQIIIS